MALCKRSGLMAWTINTCLHTKTAKLSLITSLCTKPIKTWTYLLKEADLLSYWRWYVLFTLWTALERHPQISAVQLKILVQVCKSVLKKKKERERQFRKISNTEVNYWKGERLLLFSSAGGFLWSLYSVFFRDSLPQPYRTGGVATKLSGRDV